jgi:hypothetical protein
MTVADLPSLNSAKISLNSSYLQRSAVNSYFTDSMNWSVLASVIMSQEGGTRDLGKYISIISPNYPKYSLREKCYMVSERETRRHMGSAYPAHEEKTRDTH